MATLLENRPTTSHEPGRRSRLLTVALVVLACAEASAAAVGPVGFGVLRYRTSSTMLNQLVGVDGVSLFVVAPLALVSALLVHRGRRAGTLLATGIAVYVLYTSSQVVIGQEYLRMDGNVERFFPLLLTEFIAAEVVLVLSWRGLGAGSLAMSVRLRRAAGTTLLVIAAFLVVGLHLPSMVTAWTDPGAMVEYASAPTPFWMVKLMDLGIVVPAAVAAGLGLLRGRAWATSLAYPLLTGYALLSSSVLAMAVVMLVNGDPDSSLGLTVGFALATAALAALVGQLLRRLETSD